MNKQEVLDYIIEKNKTHQKNNTFQRGYRLAMRHVYNRVVQLDEPEKPVLSKAEDEWLTRVKMTYPMQSDQLRIITRQGWGYDFEVTVYGKEYKLSYKPYKSKGEDLEHVKERLINAVLYGYEVGKEKLYKVSFKRNGIGIGVQQQDGSFKEQFTKTELSEYGLDNLDEYEIKEVEE